MKLSNREGWCLILLTAIQLGYSIGFDEEALRDYLINKKPVPSYLISALETEASKARIQICIDGKAEEAISISERIYPTPQG